MSIDKVGKGEYSVGTGDRKEAREMITPKDLVFYIFIGFVILIITMDGGYIWLDFIEEVLRRIWKLIKWMFHKKS